jgi:hypothetical protein
MGIDAYLDACPEPVYGRIVIQEVPAVFGNARYREIEEAYPMALLTAIYEIRRFTPGRLTWVGANRLEASVQDPWTS